MATAGFEEDRQIGYEGKARRSVPLTNLKMDPAGRIIIPAELRAAMQAQPGEPLTARVVDGELRVVSRAWIMHRIDEEAERFRSSSPDANLADELAANRHEEVRLEDERWARLESEAGEPRPSSARDR